MSARRRAPVEGDREWDEDEEYADAPGKGLPASGANRLAEEEGPYHVDDLCDRAGLALSFGSLTAATAGPHLRP